MPAAIVESLETVDWSSLTFAGQRHRIDLRVAPSVGAVAAAALADGIDLPGHIVADTQVFVTDGGDGHARLTIVLLTIDDRR